MSAQAVKTSAAHIPKMKRITVPNRNSLGRRQLTKIAMKIRTAKITITVHFVKLTKPSNVFS
jgi:hypothetical protein